MWEARSSPAYICHTYLEWGKPGTSEFRFPSITWLEFYILCLSEAIQEGPFSKLLKQGQCAQQTPALCYFDTSLNTVTYIEESSCRGYEAPHKGWGCVSQPPRQSNWIHISRNINRRSVITLQITYKQEHNFPWKTDLCWEPRYLSLFFAFKNPGNDELLLFPFQNSQPCIGEDWRMYLVILVNTVRASILKFLSVPLNI